MSEPLPQLSMRNPDLSKLPELVLPETLSLHTEDERSPASWERIITDSFRTPFSYKMMTDDPSYAPDRVYFVREHTQDIATAAAYLREDAHPGEGYIHMVGAHKWGMGQNAGYYAVLAALLRHKNDGLTSAVLTTDDFRLPAIAIYLRLGFEPVMNHESSQGRWDAVMANLRAYQKVTPARIPLWEAGKAPYIAESKGQAEPSLMPFPVKGSKGAMVVCPGGGYVGKAWYEGDPISRMLKAGGISAYTLDYRVAPCSVEAPLADAQRAIRVLRSMGYEKVGVMGFSAGGHIACMCAVHYDLGKPDSDDPIERFSCRPDAFAPCYGLTDWGRYQESIGQKGDGERYDCPRYVTGDTPPAFIWHTFNDGTVCVDHALKLMGAMQKAGAPFESHIYPDGVHGLGLAFGTSAEGWGELLQKWLIHQGFGA